MNIALAIVMLLGDPPPEFDYEPVEPYAIQMVAPDLVDDYCGNQPGMIELACWNEWFGRIYIRDDLDPDAFRYVLRHEKAHVNGWRH